MRLYENAWESKYEEIKTWYPVWYRDILEMDALWRIWGKCMDEIQANIIQAVDNNFIDFADVRTVGKLEDFLDIIYDSPHTLTERRNVVKAYIIGGGHIGQQDVKEIMSALTSGEIKVELVGGTVKITVIRDFGDEFNLFDARSILDRRIPAHLGIWLVDGVLPISFINRERFIFINLAVNMALNNAGKYLLYNLNIGVKIKNYGGSGRIIDGSFLLNGSQNLNYSSSAINGMTFPKFEMSAYKFKNKFTLISREYYNTVAKNSNIINNTDCKISGVKTHQTYGFSGKITIDSRWQINVAYNLDGVRKLTSTFIEEDL